MLALIVAMLAPAPDAVLALAPSGTVTVVMADADEVDGSDDGPFAEAVGQALGEANFTLMPKPGHSRYVAEVSVAHEARGVVATKAPTDKASAGIGSWGPTVRVPLGSNKKQLHDLVLTTLTVRIVSTADHRAVWEGSAVNVQPDGVQASLPLKLARAVVAAYPHPLAGPVSVP